MNWSIAPLRRHATDDAHRNQTQSDELKTTNKNYGSIEQSGPFFPAPATHIALRSSRTSSTWLKTTTTKAAQVLRTILALMDSMPSLCHSLKPP